MAGATPSRPWHGRMLPCAPEATQPLCQSEAVHLCYQAAQSSQSLAAQSSQSLAIKSPHCMAQVRVARHLAMAKIRVRRHPARMCNLSDTPCRCGTAHAAQETQMSSRPTPVEAVVLGPLVPPGEAFKAPKWRSFSNACRRVYRKFKSKRKATQQRRPKLRSLRCAAISKRGP